LKEDFLKYQAQTSPFPLSVQVSRAEGSYIYDVDDKAYLDFVAGVSACSVGHRHPKVTEAIHQQVDRYMHVMVYGEYILQPAVVLTKRIASLLPMPLEMTYLTNSGTEAMEGAIKLAKRVTGRSQLISAHLAYHGNTIGSLSLMSYEDRKQAFRPLVPGISHIVFNEEEDLKKITKHTAAVVLETIQGGAGFILPTNDYLKKVRQRCSEVGALLILDEIQPGIGRTGTFFSFEHYGVIPDIVVMGKGLGGGLPVGAFSASKAHMMLLSDNPMLGHITTFGGNPVVAAACLATIEVVVSNDLMSRALDKEVLFRERLVHPLIKEIRGKGLMLALILPTPDLAVDLVMKAQQKGLILFFLLFEKKAVRISPPLTISEAEIYEGCDVILDILNEIS